MSRILRRPMFRGGRVDSRGTGITSGLSYAKGGSVNTPKRGLVDGPGGYGGKDPFSQFIDPYFDRFNKWIGNVHPEGYVPQPIPQRNFAEDMSWLFGPGKFLKAGGGGFNLIRQMGKYPKFPPGYRSGKLDKYVDPKLLSNEWYMSKIRPYLSGAKETLSGAGSKIKEFGTTGAIGTVGGGWGLAKLYDMWKNNRDALQVKKEETGDPEIDPQIAALNDQIAELEKLLLEQAKVKKSKTLSKEEKIAKIKENEEMFREVYGSGRGEDATAMLLNFAGKALKPEATVKSAFGEFFEEEGKRPSERKKYKDAAAQAAIQSFLTGEKTMAEVDAYMSKVMGGEKAKAKLLTDIAKSESLNKRISDKAGKYTTKTAAFKGELPLFLEDNEIPYKGITYAEEEDVDLTGEKATENVGEVFVDVDKNVVFIVVLEDGVIKKKYLNR